MPSLDDLGARVASKGTDLYDLQSLPARPLTHPIQNPPHNSRDECRVQPDSFFFFLSRRNILPFPLPDGPRATQHLAVHCVVGHTGGLGPSGGLQCGIHPCWCGSGDVYMSKQTCLNRDLSKYGSGSKVMAFSWMEEL